MQHTPGPWVSDGHSIYGPKHGESKHPNKRVLVAVVASGNYRASPELFGGAEMFGFSSKRDVALITAAPDLLDACEALLDSLDSLALLDACDCDESGTCAVCKAKAAIAKANGRSK